MRAGIVTYWNSDNNYGQILQCYALQQYLKSIGIDAFLIKYSPVSSGYKERLRKLLSSATWKNKFHYYRNNSFYKNELSLKIINDSLNKERAFEQFRNQFITSTDIIYSSIEDLRRNPPLADIYITGSDQVWRNSLFDVNTAGWFLDFGTNVKRISYAASIGRAISNTEKKVLRKYLTNFEGVSVREASTKKMLQTLRKDVELVVDPTLLLTRNDYLDLISKNNIVNEQSSQGKYILIYVLNVKSKEDLYWSQINHLKSEKQWNINVICSSGYIEAREILAPEYKNIRPTIEGWISKINCAEFVITSSFHGLLFSIILNKPFAVVLLGKNNKKSNERIFTILNLLKLENRIISESNNLSSISDMKIDWNVINHQIDKLKLKSKDFLNKFLFL